MPSLYQVHLEKSTIQQKLVLFTTPQQLVLCATQHTVKRIKTSVLTVHALCPKHKQRGNHVS